jgi:predicted nucleotidyltransferase
MVSAIVERQTELSELCERFGVKRLEVFGSASSGEAFDPQTSDVDFIVEFRAGQELGPWLRHYFAFREALSKLIGYPVDLVMASAMKNPYFIREANRTRRLLYGTLERQAACGYP